MGERNACNLQVGKPDGKGPLGRLRVNGKIILEWILGKQVEGLGIFLFTTTSRPSLEPTHPPIKWVPGTLSPRGEASRS
jgi:hypothetical protein